jgi:hypothetical protein
MHYVKLARHYNVPLLLAGDGSRGITANKTFTIEEWI